MFATTREAVKAICKTDATISEEQLAGALAALDGKGAKAEAVGCAYTREEVARLMKVTVATVTRLAKKGMLTPVNTLAKKRVRRYTGESVRRLLEAR